MLFGVYAGIICLCLFARNLFVTLATRLKFCDSIVTCVVCFAAGHDKNLIQATFGNLTSSAGLLRGIISIPSAINWEHSIFFGLQNCLVGSKRPRSRPLPNTTFHEATRMLSSIFGQPLLIKNQVSKLQNPNQLILSFQRVRRGRKNAFAVTGVLPSAEFV